MKVSVIAAALLALAGVAQAQVQDGRRRPWNTGGEKKPWEGYNKGVKWEASLDAAKIRAAKEGKPIILYQLVGDLAKEGC